MATKQTATKPARRQSEASRLSYEQKKQMKLKAQKVKQAEKAKQGDPTNKDRFYCTNKQLLAELIKWRDSAKNVEDRVISEELGRMFMALTAKILNRSEFRNYPRELKEDLQGFAWYKLIRGLKNYDFNFTNPFSWCSTSIFNSYLTCLKKYYKQINIKKDLMQKLLSEMESFPGMNSATSLSRSIKQYIEEDAD